jgi:hypothetical protein
MRRLALTLLALAAMTGFAEARTLFTARVACTNGGVPEDDIKGTIILHYVPHVTSVRLRLEGLTPGATVTAGYTCIEGTEPTPKACSSTPGKNGKLSCTVSFPTPSSCIGGSPFINVSSPAALCAPGFIDE